MTFKPLDINTSPDKGGATHVVEFSYKDLTAAGNTQTLTPFTLPANWGVEVVHMELPEAFVSSDGTLISTAITAGDGGSANRLLTSTELNAAGTEIFNKGGATTAPYVPTSDTAQTISVTGTSAKLLNTHTAGQCRVFYRLTNPFSNRGAVLPFDITTKAAQ